MAFSWLCSNGTRNEHSSGTPDDADAIARINVETRRDAYAGILPDRVLVNVSISRRKATGALRYSSDIGSISLKPRTMELLGLAVVGHKIVEYQERRRGVYALFFL